MKPARHRIRKAAKRAAHAARKDNRKPVVPVVNDRGETIGRVIEVKS